MKSSHSTTNLQPPRVLSQPKKLNVFGPSMCAETRAETHYADSLKTSITNKPTHLHERAFNDNIVVLFSFDLCADKEYVLCTNCV